MNIQKYDDDSKYFSYIKVDLLKLILVITKIIKKYNKKLLLKEYKNKGNNNL